MASVSPVVVAAGCSKIWVTGAVAVSFRPWRREWAMVVDDEQVQRNGSGEERALAVRIGKTAGEAATCMAGWLAPQLV
jgi:hypothetical protein